MILDGIRMTASVGDLTLNILKLKYLEPGTVSRFENHCHSGYELHFVPEGRGRLIVSGKIYEITPETFYFTGPGVYHAQLFDPKNPMAEYCINFDIELSKISHAKGDICERDMYRIRKALADSSFWFGKDTDGNLLLLDKISEEARHKHIGYLANIKKYLEIIILNTVRYLGKNMISSETPPAKDYNDKRRLITDQYVQESWKSPSIQELAATLGISERQLNRVFLCYYGASFSRTMTRIRMQKAAELLKGASLPVKEIAELSGYEDPGYFCRLFKRHFGVSATQYKKSLNTV